MFLHFAKIPSSFFFFFEIIFQDNTKNQKLPVDEVPAPAVQEVRTCRLLVSGTIFFHIVLEILEMSLKFALLLIASTINSVIPFTSHRFQKMSFI